MAAPQLSPKQEQRREELETLTTETLEKLVAELAEGHTQNFIDLLTFFSRFHKFSLRNCLLIKQQRPHATRVASYNAWKKVGCQVAQGATAIWVFAPLLILQKDEATGEKVEKLIGFRPTPVFDASQLNEESQAKLPSPYQTLPDDVGDLWHTFVARCEARNYRVTETSLPSGVQGSCTAAGRIKVADGLDSRTKVLVLAHELAHMSHWEPEAKDLSNADCELQAEACSVVIGAMLGIEHPSARDYLISWNGTPDTLREHFQAIQKIVRKVVDILGIGESKTQVDHNEAA